MATDSGRRRILITDGEQRASLAVVRSLGAAGHTVYVSAGRKRSVAGASHFAEREYTVAAALASPACFVDDIRAVAIQNAVDTIIPMTEPALLALLPEREQFPNVLIPFTDAATFAAISDKQAVLDAATSLGIAVPMQMVIEDSPSAASFNASTIGYPIVVKPARSVSSGTGDRLKLSVQHANSATELRAILSEMDARAYPLLLQQRVLGPGIGIFALIWDGRLIGQFAHQRIREKPPSGGISVYRKSIPVDPELFRLSLALLAEFSWNGVAMVEYKIDERTGTPYLMEINGRFWGSLQLAVDSGVDFPRLLIEAATGGAPKPVTSFRSDVHSRWFWGEVDHLLARMRKSDEQLSLPPGTPSRWATMRAFLRRDPNDVSEVLKWGDTRPFLRESIQWFQQLGK